ncbi:MAG: hypothetical protein KDC53_20780, partial [Saprospiraceae bacterium]|nr:hypothetical protein [Saprospiraceae bacterium]
MRYQDIIIITVVLLSLNSMGYGQKDVKIKVTKDDQLIFPRSDYQLKIIDARQDTTYLGFILRGLNYGKHNVNFKKPVSKALQEMVKSSHHSEHAPVLYLKLLKLEASQYITSGVVSHCEIVADLLVDDHEKLSLVGQKSYVLSRRGNKSVRTLKDGLIQLVQRTLIDFSLDTIQRPEFMVKRTDLRSPGNYLELKYAIEDSNGPLKKGLYQSVIDFRNNDPTVQEDFVADWSPIATRENLQVKIKSKIDGKIIRDIWGFSDGRNCFYNLGDKYHLLEFSEKRDTFKFKVDVKSLSSIPGVVGGIFGGVLGALVGQALNSLTAQKSSLDFQIDLTTGNLILMQNKSQLEHKDFQLIIFRNSKPKFKDSYVVYANDENIGVLDVSRSMVSIKIPALHDSIKISLTRQSDDTAIVRKEMVTDDLFFIVEEKKELFKLRRLDRKQSSYHR